MKKIILFISVFVFTLLLFHSYTPDEASAKKKIRRGGATVTFASKPIITAKLRSDRKALIVNFTNLSTASSVSYELTYFAEGISQGVAGNITPSDQTSTQRELLFGTCSKNVCRYHTNITQMKLMIISSLKSGVKIKKTFRIKP